MVTSHSSRVVEEMDFTPIQSDSPPLVTPDGKMKTEECFFPPRSMSTFPVDETKTNSIYNDRCEAYYRSSFDEIERLLNPEATASRIPYGALQDYNYDWCMDSKLSNRLSSPTLSERTDQERKPPPECPSDAQLELVDHDPRFQEWHPYIQLTANDRNPGDESTQVDCYDFSEYSQDFAFECIPNEFKPIDSRKAATPATECPHVLAEGTNICYAEQNIREQAKEISTWRSMKGPVSYRSYAAEAAQRTDLQDVASRTEIMPSKSFEIRRKDSSAEEWICSDVKPAFPLRCRNSRTDELSQYAISTYTDLSSPDRELSIEARKRIKNNAASRRSRACRKQRFKLMEMQVNRLNRANSSLQEFLRELDCLLLEAKEILLQQATKFNNSKRQHDNQTFSRISIARGLSYESETKS
ncbi:hypothetical protein AAHC03_05350 [Spirometra sp. Aus1]